ncbi:MAG: hypothetical protein E7Z91_05050 [Cyanobacteria bacterium SIG30]|nr:hypothetical protein [Cyanobacteria bacterium SIG30]
MKKDLIGFWGYVDPEIVKLNKKMYPDATFIDLDVGTDAPSSKIVPDSYCKIIKNIFDNAFFYKERLIKILAPIGKDKCDSGFFAANILKEFGFNVETLFYEVIAQDYSKLNTPISKSNLPLKKKIEIITANIIDLKEIKTTQVKPRFGFWGVPPHDLSILELFPDDTHVYGWTRCVEANYPADINLEMFVDEGVPTVFYAQTFCAKNQLAKYLADKYNGLYVDVDGIANNSVKAKIEAFLKLR